MLCGSLLVGKLITTKEGIRNAEETLQDIKDSSVTPKATEAPVLQVTENVEIQNDLATIYRSKKCLYISPASSVFVGTGDYNSGHYYHFTEIGFEAIEMTAPGEAGIRWDYYLPEGGPVWEEFPFTTQEWTELFVDGDKSDLLNGYKKVDYMKLREKDTFLLKPDDELWLVITHGMEDGNYIWCIYTLVPATEKVDSIKKYYLLPQELEEKTTTELLALVSQNNMSALIFEDMSLFLEALCRRYNGAEELVKRDDLAKVVLEEFNEDTFMIKKDLPHKDWEEQEAYDAECLTIEKKIALEEVLLATNIAFDQMDEEMKQATLKEAYEKVELRLSGRFACGNPIATYPSGFFGYIRATKDSGSKWYAYLVEHGEEEVLVLMEDEFVHKFKP